MTSEQKITGDVISFRCNICGSAVTACPLERIDREIPSCAGCGSTVRFRGVAYLLSVAVLGEVVPLAQWPERKHIVGIGLSDWHVMADFLASKVTYTNTYFHQEPLLDITAPAGYEDCADFLISSEVFEHVPPPVQRAFDGAFRVLKPGGHLILTVPFTLDGATVEHFPDLGEYRVVELGGEHVLVNRAADGTLSVHDGLVFHGGQGETLEMRVFCEPALRDHLQSAGFADVRVLREDAPEWGILHNYRGSLPIIATRPIQAS